MANVVQWLLDCDEPWTRYRTLVDLREAERRERLWRSPRFHRLPRLVQLVLAALS